ncbi:hypothetical protein LP421_01470 (plasmid) [Rhizobium sp. RCAM05350]|nr:hypothetical protein LP421_01470 [Rhizobium sp. RCAM05350]
MAANSFAKRDSCRIGLGEMIVVQEKRERRFDPPQPGDENGQKCGHRHAAGIKATAIPRLQILQSFQQGHKEAALVAIVHFQRQPDECSTLILQKIVPLGGKRRLSVAGRRHDGRQPAWPKTLQLLQEIAAPDMLAAIYRRLKSVLMRDHCLCLLRLGPDCKLTMEISFLQIPEI